MVARGSPVSSGTRRKAVQRCPLLVELPTEQLSRSVGALPRSVGCYPGPSAPRRRYGFGGKAELFQPEPGCIPWRAAPKPTLELMTTPRSLCLCLSSAAGDLAPGRSPRRTGYCAVHCSDLVMTRSHSVITESERGALEGAPGLQGPQTPALDVPDQR